MVKISARGSALKTEKSETESNTRAASGILFGGAAFLIWGFSPVYWKVIQAAPAPEIIAHRIIWSFAFLLPLILFQGRWRAFTATFRDQKTLLILLCTSIFVGANWLIYIWAVNNGHILQASLGYYINPLVNVLLGMLFLGERLRRAQGMAVLLAAAGVVYLTVQYGVFPWISLTLAFSFGLYGLIRKVVAVGSLIGLTFETLLLGLPALGYLFYLEGTGAGSFLHAGLQTSFFLMGSAMVTALPLLLFTIGARRLTLASLGFLQYLAPTCMFLLGVLVYHEPFSRAQLVTFTLIWTALGIYSADSVRVYRRAARARA